jgi:photosystem II stability/assembly factor-like uncharacterized protein
VRRVYVVPCLRRAPRGGAAVALLLLSACSGGGGGPAATPTTTTTTTSLPAVPITQVTSSAASADVQDFTPVSASTWWAVVVGRRYRVARTVDSGRHWRNVTPGPKFFGTSDFLDADDAWLEGGSVASTPGADAIFRTVDGGRSWQRVGAVPSDCELEFVDARHGWCSGTGAAAGSEAVTLWRTIDGGTTWKLASRGAFAEAGPPPSTPGALPTGCDKFVVFTSPTFGWAPFQCNGGGPDMYGSTDAGETWHQLPPIALPPGSDTDCGTYLSAPAVHGNDIAVSLRIGCAPSHVFVITSTEGGGRWRTQPVPHATRPWTADLIDPVHWRLTDGSVLMSTGDGGAHWQTTPLPPSLRHLQPNAPTLQFLTPTLGWMLNEPNGAPLAWTRDGGATWKRIVVTTG